MADEPLDDLRMRGITAAAEVFDRLTAELGAGAGRDEAPRAAANGAPVGSDPVGQQQLRAAAARMIDLFAGLFQQSFEAYVELAQAIVQPPSGGVAVSAGGGAGLTLGAAAGANACATVWVHNPTIEPAPSVTLRLTDCTAPDGARIDATLARFAPAALAVGAGESASALLSLAIPARMACGVYFGHVLTAELPDVALPVRVEVKRPLA